ncbi:glycosyltransferase family 2 protein [Enterocloster lavalensis]|uniref:glycosyltransferase family 2 protein n=1 Tax=Enterocloster lavalensis TaxID=460384 RepID=UPI00266662DD|nr:glycosyltransferase family 2 protein [Enterocloster lavalensis]
MSEKITVIITMAGLGTRFRKVGYNCPKYMIEARGKSLFEWSMDSLIGYKDHVSKYVFVVREEDKAACFIKTQCAKYGINDVDIVELDHMTDGQATTCMLAIPYCNPDDAIMVYNIDTYVEPYEMKYEDISGDGHIPCFHADGDHWSFAKLDENGAVVEVREKVRISDNCTLGAYYFSSAKLYKDLYGEYYADDSRMEKNEKYIAPLYNFMIEKGMSVTISIVNADKVHVLGTPEELKAFTEGDSK